MLLPREVWKDIPGYEGKYQVSNLGNIRSLNYRRTGKVKRLKLGGIQNGYKIVILTKDGKQEGYSIHRLVALAFIPNPNNYPEVNHKDENPSNNCVWNLEWCTRKYNNNYGNRNEKISNAIKGRTSPMKGKTHTDEARKKSGEANRKKIRCIELNITFDSIIEATRYFNTSKNNISRCLRGKQQTALGYH